MAQLDTTVRDLEYRSFPVELDEVHGERAAVVRLAGSVFCLVAASGTFLGGFALLCGDPGDMDWEEALDLFLSQTPFDRSAVTWVPGDEPEGM